VFDPQGLTVPSEAFQAELQPDTDRGVKSVNFQDLERIGRELLVAIGEDADRDGLRDTPSRFARMWRDFIEYDPGILDTSFTTTSTNELVAIGPIRVWSKCEHHLVDFWTDLVIAVQPDGQILGLSKFARIAHKNAHRLQVQEQLVSDTWLEISLLLDTHNVAVYGRGEHLCMVARGIRSTGHMTNYRLGGSFADSHLRHEFLSLATGARA
jgi:GTP cyclohydrolase IA